MTTHLTIYIATDLYKLDARYFDAPFDATYATYATLTHSVWRYLRYLRYFDALRLTLLTLLTLLWRTPFDATYATYATLTHSVWRYLRYLRYFDAALTQHIDDGNGENPHTLSLRTVTGGVSGDTKWLNHSGKEIVMMWEENDGRLSIVPKRYSFLNKLFCTYSID